MELIVEERLSSGVVKNHNIAVSLPRFLKSFSIAGSGQNRMSDIVFGSIGFMATYRHYTGPLFSPFYFVPPPAAYYNPTTQGQLSNQIGTAIADILARHLSNAKYTHTYEAALKAKNLPIEGVRPDLYCETGFAQFSMEAKGFDVPSVSAAAMAKHKTQAQSGSLNVNFSVACVSYNLYSPTVYCKYFDPVSSNVPYDADGNLYLRRLFYQRVMASVDNAAPVSSYSLGRETYLEFRVNRPNAPRLEDGYINILINQRILDFIANRTSDISIDIVDSNLVFIDSDGIGIRLT